MHQSVATISSPEFINLQPIDKNPLMSSCEIKVLYLGENRNHSYITKEVATEMSKTLRGAPIVGYYRDEHDDFADHGEKVTLDCDGIKFECMTKPYGFVAPDAQVWFQKFQDIDDFGNETEREYLMTTGYLWTGQFPECADVIQNGRPQSMELEESSLDGYWSTNSKTNIDFFIINDATFSKLCILGNDVEPCFEGASVTAPEVSKTFSLDDEFKQTLYTMMQDLKGLMSEGGQMEELENQVVTEVAEEESIATEFTAEAQNSTEESAIEEAENEFACDDDKHKESKCEKADDEEEKVEETPEEEPAKEEEPAAEEDKEEEASDEEEKKKYSLLEEEFAQLQTAFAELETRYNELVEFKKAIDEAKKDELINSFYMLSEEDKADVIANKSNYSYDDIEKELSVICVRKKVSFANENSAKENPIATVNVTVEEQSAPAWVSALKDARKKNNI